MKLTAALLLTAVAASSFAANPHTLDRPQQYAANALAHVIELERRLEPANGASGYTPQIGACPATAPTIRLASGLSTEETSWLATRRPVVIDAMQTLLTRINITGFDVATYFSNYSSNTSVLPNIGIAASGGGYRAMMNGGGALAAFDDRSTGSTSSGQLGGLLQSATYLAGLSGASWLVGSIYANNFTSVQDIINGVTPVWDFTNSIIEGPNHGLQILTSAEYYDDLYDEVRGKDEAGFNITLTDFWGRGLSYQFINADDGGPAYTFSSLQNQTFFTNGSVPFPLIISDGRLPNQVIIPGNATIFEFNPFEMGSWDPTLYGFTPLQYLGTNMTNGSTDSTSACVTGLDNIGFVYGTSSTLFNQIVLQFNSTVSLPSILENLIQDALNDFGESNNDISDINNPFYQYHNGNNPWADTRELTLVDGGEDGENIPLHPLIQPYREVDTIFAVDSSADTDTYWPNGTSLVATYERSLNATIQNHTVFPYIPDQNTFVNLGLNLRPTFFGCNASNYTTPPPLIIYIPNSPYTTMSNVSTYDLSYPDSQRNAIITNGYNVASRANTTSGWDVCVGCAIIRRSLERTNTAFPDACTTCFTEYCWNGTTNATTPVLYEPALGAAAALIGGSATSSTASGTASSTAASSTSTKKSDASSSLTAGKASVFGLTLASVAGFLAF